MATERTELRLWVITLPPLPEKIRPRIDKAKLEIDIKSVTELHSLGQVRPARSRPIAGPRSRQ